MKKIITVILLIIFLFSLYKVSTYLYESWQTRRINNEFRDRYYGEIEMEEVSKGAILPRYLSILEINRDVVGWITVPNTRIDYPVVKAKDNDYYLRRNIYHEDSRAGSIFMDYRNEGDGSDRHTILYGHHMRDGTMFKDLVKYKNREFFDENRVIVFNTLYEEISWEIFSVYITDTDFYYIETYFGSDDEYEDFINVLEEKSLFKTDIDLSSEDTILTLSTCTYEYEDARFVVHAKRIQ